MLVVALLAGIAGLASSSFRSPADEAARAQPPANAPSPAPMQKRASSATAGDDAAPAVLFKAAPPARKDEAGYARIDFALLAGFAFTPQPPTPVAVPAAPDRLPAAVCALDGRPVCIHGFMLPLKMENGLAKEFLILRNTLACCFGVMPAPNEWVVVRMKGPGAVPLQDQPLKFYGTLHVGETYEDGQFSGLYQMDGEKVAADSSSER